jgi:hypothetical protein
MAPFLLGESGKTISDGDRRLIAEALGLAERGEKGGFRWIQSSSISKGELILKVNMIKNVLARNRTELDNNFARIVTDLGGSIERPDEATITKESRRADVPVSPFILEKTDQVKDGIPIYALRRRA